MSTKIYNGYKLPYMDHVELMSFLKRLQSEIEVKAKELYVKVFADIAVGSLDNACLGNYPEDEKDEFTPYTYADIMLIKRAKKIEESGLRDPLFDFQFDVVVIPRSDCMLAIIFFEKKELQEVWESQKEVEYYGYWNNTDEPEGMNSDDWEKRGQEWDDAVGGDPVSFAGYTYECVNKYRLQVYDIRDFSPYIDSYTKRVDWHAHESLMEAYRDENKWSSSAYKTWLKTEEGKAALKKQKNHVKSKLKKEITRKDLNENIAIPAPIV